MEPWFHGQRWPIVETLDPWFLGSMAKLPPGVKQFSILVPEEMHTQLKVFAALHHTSVQELTVQAYEAILNDVHSRTSVTQAKPKRGRR